MPKKLTIFISSPGDVGQERLITQKVIQRLDAEFGDETTLAPYFWEYEPVVITQDYQAQIPPPSSFDIVICILWSRLGSRLHSSHKLPPDFEKIADSGTEYEFVDAAIANKEKGTPEILVWLNSSEPSVPLRAADRDARIAQWEKLQVFLAQWTRDQEEQVFKGAVNSYQTREQFEKLLEAALRKKVLQLLDRQEGEIRSRPRWPGNPYRGLRVFEYRHSPIFFGRTAAVSEAVDKIAERLPQVWREQEAVENIAAEFLDRGVEPKEEDIPTVEARAFLLVFGASGSGKSSLARAGILPTLTGSGAVAEVGEWRCAVMKPSISGKNPFLALAQALVSNAETSDSLEECDLPEGIEMDLLPAALPELTSDGRSANALADLLKRQPDSAGELIRASLAHAGGILAEQEKANLQRAIERDRKEERHIDAETTEKRLADYVPKRVCLVLVLDQMEELFTGGLPDTTLETFFRVLDALAASGRVVVIATLRSEFFSRCLGKEPYQKVLGSLISGGVEQKLAPPLSHELGQMIRKPAQAAGVRFEETTDLGKLDERIRDAALREPDSLPLLEFCLEKLYEVGSHDGLLEHHEYGIDEKRPGIGQLEGVLEQHAEKLFDDDEAGCLKPHQQESLHPVILQLAAEGASQEGGSNNAAPEIVRRTVRYDELILAGSGKTHAGGDEASTPAKALVDAFIEARLFTTDRDADGNRTVSVTHEALLRKWDRVKAWLGLDENRRFLRVRARVAQKLDHWKESGEKRGFLLQPGPELGEAEEQFREHDEAFSREECEFILASRAEAAEREIRQRRVKNGVIAALSVLSLLALVGAGMALFKQREAEMAVVQAEEQTDRANQSVLEAAMKAWGASRQAFDENDDTGAGFARLAEAIRYDEQLPEEMRVASLHDDAIMRVASRRRVEPIPTRRWWQEGNVQHMEVDPECTRIVTTSQDGTATIWDATTGLILCDPLQHVDWVDRAAFSPDGTRIVTTSRDGTARIWDATSGVPIGDPLQHEGEVYHARFSPDGTCIVTAGGYTAWIWDARSGALLGDPLQHENVVDHATFSPDGTYIATASRDGTARIWDATSGIPQGDPLQHGTTVLHAAFSPDGSRIVTASLDNTARIWDATSGVPLSDPIQHEDCVNHAAFSPDCTRIVTASDDNTARIWDATSGVPLSEPLQHEDSVNHAAFSPDGTRIVTASADDTARIWDATTGVPLGDPLQHEDNVNHAAFSQDGTHIVTVSNREYGNPFNSVSIWETTQGVALSESIQHKGHLYRVALSPDGTCIVTASADNTARIWDATSGLPLSDPLQHEDWVYYAAFSPDGTRIVTASKDGTARIWDATSGVPIGDPLQHENDVTYAVFSLDGARVVTRCGRGVRIWDATSGSQLCDPLQHKAPLYHVELSPSGTRIVTACEDGTARIWDATSGVPIGDIIQHKGMVRHAAFSPDGNRIVTASWDNTARIWSAKSGIPLSDPLQHDDKVNYAAFSPNGTCIVTTSEDNTARIWDATSGVPLDNPLQHGDNIEYVAFSPDATRIVTASWDDTGRVWDATSGAPLSDPLPHESDVLHAAFSPDGNRIVTASRDNTARFWDIESGVPLGAPLCHESWVTHVTFSPDGTRIVTTGGDNTARIWRVLPKLDFSAKSNQIEVFAGYKVDPDGVVVPLPVESRITVRDRIASSLERTYFDNLFLSRLENVEGKSGAEHVLRWIGTHQGHDRISSLTTPLLHNIPGHPLLPFALSLNETNPTRKQFLIDYGTKQLADSPAIEDKLTALRLKSAAHEGIENHERALSLRLESIEHPSSTAFDLISTANLADKLGRDDLLTKLLHSGDKRFYDDHEWLEWKSNLKIP